MIGVGAPMGPSEEELEEEPPLGEKEEEVFLFKLWTSFFESKDKQKWYLRKKKGFYKNGFDDRL